MAWSALLEGAARQHGVITAAQAVEAGVSAAALCNRADREGWRRVVRGVYVVAGAPETPLQRAWIAIRVAGEGAALARWSAAWALGLRDDLPALVQVVVPASTQRRGHRMVEIHRSRILTPGDIVERDGLPVTSPAFQPLDLAAAVDRVALRAHLIDGRQQRVFDLAEVAARAAESPGATGRPRLFRVLHELDGDRVESEFARRVIAWLRGEGFPVVSEHPLEIPGGRILHLDAAIVDDQVGIETEGLGAHSSRHQLTSDTRRANHLALRPDWIVLRLTWDRFTRDRAGFLAELADALATAPDRVNQQRSA